MKVLFIGGTGVISSACSQLAVDRGIELYLLNRGLSTTHRAPAQARILQADARDAESVARAVGDLKFDVVVNWIAYTPEHVEADIAAFTGKTGQYIFISSASAYQTPPVSLPITEAAPLDNPFWDYSRAKIAGEERLLRAYRETKFPFTIVRPSHTYDCTKSPLYGGYLPIRRMKQGKPVIVFGDGTSLWTLTHHTDFARAFVGLLGNSRALGQTFHITSDEWLTWNRIYQLMADALGVKPQLVHLPTNYIAAFDPERGPGLLGDKMHSMIFDNSAIKRVVPDFVATIPFSRGAKEIVAWFESDLAHQVVDEQLDVLMDTMIARYQAIIPVK